MRFINTNTLVVATGRLATVGLALPLLHFLVLPLGLFGYAVNEMMSHGRDYDSLADAVKLTMPLTAFDGYFWLMEFWLWAAGAVPVFWASHRLLAAVYADNRFALAFSRAALAFVATSGWTERLIASKFMSLPVEMAPAFSGSLYSDLGELVRAPWWSFGSHSLVARYSLVLCGALALCAASYVVVIVSREIKDSLRLYEGGGPRAGS